MLYNGLLPIACSMIRLRTFVALAVALLLSRGAIGDELVAPVVEPPVEVLDEEDECCPDVEALDIEVIDVDDVQVGMQGVGKTVLQGTEIVEFNAEVLGVMRGVSPGRDLVLCRLSGANLEYTGVIAGMSGSPIYLDGKLLGAVAYTWAFNKEPIAGVTPFRQMVSFAASPVSGAAPVATTSDGLMAPAALDLSRDPFQVLDEVASQAPVPVATAQGEMKPLALPLSATNFSEQSLAELRKHLAPFGLLPMASGGVSSDVTASEPEQPIVPGASLGASLVTGDFDLSGIGTATHVAGNRVWGWGHPFMSGGRCHYVLRSGHVHLVNPKQDLSTKMGSVVSTLGIINADVSTCIAGELGATPDMLPMTVTLDRVDCGSREHYQVEIVRHPTLLGPLVSTVLRNVLDGSGAIENEITVGLDATIRAEGLSPITVNNIYSGGNVAGNQGAQGLLNQVAVIADGLTRNPYRETRLESIECHAWIKPERTSATITRVRIDSDRYEPGDTLRATVTLRPYKCEPRDVPLSLELPRSIAPGNYEVMVCDATLHLKSLFAEQPQLLIARDVDQIADVFRRQLEEKRDTIYLRVVLPDSGVALGDVTLPQLPSSMQTALGSRRASSGQSVRRALVARSNTEWVIEGAAKLRFSVVENKRVSG